MREENNKKKGSKKIPEKKTLGKLESPDLQGGKSPNMMAQSLKGKVLGDYYRNLEKIRILSLPYAYIRYVFPSFLTLLLVLLFRCIHRFFPIFLRGCSFFMMVLTKSPVSARHIIPFCCGDG